MITRADLVERANAWQLSENVVEKDYVIGWLLWGIGTHPQLSLYWAFKGGTCLKKCFFETYRFSEDLDFSVLPDNPFQGEDQVFDVPTVAKALEDVVDRVQEVSGIDFSVREILIKPRNEGRTLEGRVYYLGPTGTPQVGKIKLDISGTEVVVRPTVLAPVRHSFPDTLPGPATVRAYSFEEVFAEKIRAMGERGRPRDLYDIINLFRHQGLGKAPELIRDVLIDKCASKGVPVPTEATVLGTAALEELRAEWENMLGHQLPALPPIESYLGELDSLFLWLDGELEVDELVHADFTRDTDPTWRPPPILSTWNGAPIEIVRFAAANLLRIRIGYEGDHRVVEPYALRRSRDGHLLLYAQRPEEDQIKAYRVDRIEGVEVRSEAFEPRHPVEFTPGGPITVRPTRRGPETRGGSLPGRTAARRYIVQCPVCGKTFPRKRPSTRLWPHKDTHGFRCPGRVGNRLA